MARAARNDGNRISHLEAVIRRQPHVHREQVQLRGIGTREHLEVVHGSAAALQPMGRCHPGLPGTRTSLGKELSRRPQTEAAEVGGRSRAGEVHQVEANQAVKKPQRRAGFGVACHRRQQRHESAQGHRTRLTGELLLHKLPRLVRFAGTEVQLQARRVELRGSARASSTHSRDTWSHCGGTLYNKVSLGRCGQASWCSLLDSINPASLPGFCKRYFAQTPDLRGRSGGRGRAAHDEPSLLCPAQPGPPATHVHRERGKVTAHHEAAARARERDVQPPAVRG
mmetsp:Transcript_28256/g.89837  ORF Transcript_28256/g.89837 Transcript_28256/m.89837 type:complete len:282 (+) Transcript_28256:1383-2228(+)